MRMTIENKVRLYVDHLLKFPLQMFGGTVSPVAAIFWLGGRERIIIRLLFDDNIDREKIYLINNNYDWSGNVLGFKRINPYFGYSTDVDIICNKESYEEYMRIINNPYFPKNNGILFHCHKDGRSYVKDENSFNVIDEIMTRPPKI